MATKKECRILIAMDGSRYCDYAFDWYLENVKKPDDYVIVLHCVEFDSLSAMPGDVGASGMLMHAIEKERTAADKYIQHLTERMQEAKLHGKVKRTQGPARSEILKVAKDENVDMIITGTRGMGKVRRTLLGSVSDHVLHHAHVPVLVCKHKDDHHHHGTHDSKK